MDELIQKLKKQNQTLEILLDCLNNIMENFPTQEDKSDCLNI